MTRFVGARTRSAADKLYLTFPSDAKLLEMAEQALQRPSDSGWWDEEMFVSHTHMFATPDPQLTDEYALGYSNLRSVVRDLSAAFPHPRAISMSGFRHWTYSHFVCAKVRVTYANGELHPVFAAACAIALGLQHDHPVYDEDDYYAYDAELMALYDEAILRDLDADRDSARDEELAAVPDRDWAVFRDDFLVALHESGTGSVDQGGYPAREIDAARAHALALVGTVRPTEAGLF